MKKSNVYTRAGDDGTTSLVGGERVPKSHCRIEVYGTVDELNAFLGLLSVALKEDEDRRFVSGIQRRLFAVGGYLATPGSEKGMCKIEQQCIGRMEQEIDRIDAQLPRLKSFAIPGGSEAAARAHICRTVCRRAERAAYRLSESEPVDPIILKYLNRLSDYLFVLARKLLQNEEIDENFANNDDV